MRYESVVQSGTPRLVVALSASSPALADFAGLSFAVAGGASYAVADAAQARIVGGAAEWTWTGLTRDIFADGDAYDLGLFAPADPVRAGVDEAGVNALIRSGVLATALGGNTDRWATGKLPVGWLTSVALDGSTLTFGANSSPDVVFTLPAGGGGRARAHAGGTDRARGGRERGPEARAAERP